LNKIELSPEATCEEMTASITIGKGTITRAKQKHRIPGPDPLGTYLDSVELGPGPVPKSWNWFRPGPELGPENLEPDPVPTYLVQ